jgi:hypothetical protein
MSNVPVWTTERLRAEFERAGMPKEVQMQSALQIQGWLQRGDAVLIYSNHDLGHPEVGHCVYLSYGSDEAMVPRSRFPEPPTACPVELPHGMMSWRYQLDGIYTEDELTQAVTPE